MDDPARTLITLGGLFLVGLLTDLLGRRTPLPRVSLLLLFGLVVGPSGLDLLAGLGEQWFPTVTDMALVMVGFLLGGKFTRNALVRDGREVLIFSTVVTVATAIVVVIGLWLIGMPLGLALLLGGLATATDPAATTDVVSESRGRGRFTRNLLGVVALDDALGLIAFSLLLAGARVYVGMDGGNAVVSAGVDLLGAAVLGAVLGVPAAYATGRIRPGEPTLVEALALVFLCGGIALWLDVSFIFASMVLGAVVANLAKHHSRPFHAIEGIEWPFMILFFVLAGASLELSTLRDAGVLGAGYLVFRSVGRFVGGWIAGLMSGSPARHRRWMGVSLLPQAGVALGMALVASSQFPDFKERIISVVVAATIVFEIAGAFATRQALIRVGEAHGIHNPGRTHAVES